MTENYRVQTVTETGAKAKERIKDATAAYAITDRMIKDNEQTLFLNTKLRGMYDGNPPFSQSERKRKGMAWMANFNDRTAERVIDEAVSTQWDMIQGQPTFISACWKGKYSPDAKKYGAKIADRYTRTLRSWPDLHYHINLRLQEMNKMGSGPVYWRDEWTWMSQAVKHDNLILPRRTPATTGGVKFATLRDTMDVIQLFEAIESDDASENGWNPKVCREAIKNAVKNDSRGDPYQRGSNISWASAQDRVRNRDFSTTAQFDGVPVRHLLATEMDGTVSHYILYDYPFSVGNTQKSYEYMFRMPNRFDSMQQVLHLLMYNIGDGYYYSIKPLLQRIFSACDLSNRSVCALVNAMIMSGGLIAQAKTGFQQEKISFTNIGAVTILDANVDILQSTSFSPPLDKSLIVRNVLLDILNNNRGAPRSQSNDNPVSKAQLELEQQVEAHLGAIQSSWMYVQFDQWHKETFRRLFASDYPDFAEGYKEHKALMEALKADGIPAEFLKPDMWDITATKSVGMGSTRERRNISQIMLKTLGYRTESGRKIITKMFDSAYLPNELVEELNSEEEYVTRDHQIAALENNDMKGGDAVTVGDDDNHAIHTPVHFGFMAEILKQFKADPRSAAELIQPYGLAVAHTANHLGKASKDGTRSQQIAGWTKQLKSFAAIHTQMVAVAKKVQGAMQKQQQQQAQVGFDEKLAMEKIAMEERVALAKLQSEEKVKTLDVIGQNRVRQQKADVANQAKISTAAAKIATTTVEAKEDE